MTVINLYKSFSKPIAVPISSFVSNVIYVPLETNPLALISGLIVNYEVTNDFIIVRQSASVNSQILLFDRKTGKFIKEIGKVGRGPGEFSSLGFLPYNNIKHEFYALNNSRDILVYDLAGKCIDIIKKPVTPDIKINERSVTSFLMLYDILDSDIFVGYFQNFSGNENRKLILFTRDGILKIFPNYLRWVPGKSFHGIMNPPGGFAKFYKWDNKLNFLEIFCDTLYQVTKDSLIPRYYFDPGPYKAEYSNQLEVASKTSNYYFMYDVNENKNFIFINFLLKMDGYLGFINKSDNTITVCKKGLSGNSGFQDDIGGLMEIVPNHFTQNNEMVYIIQPFKMIKWIKENPEKANEAKKRHLWLNNIDEFSNPIIAIAKCKE